MASRLVLKGVVDKVSADVKLEALVNEWVAKYNMTSGNVTQDMLSLQSRTTLTEILIIVGEDSV
jgi:hypothetical protein